MFFKIIKKIPFITNPNFQLLKKNIEFWKIKNNTSKEKFRNIFPVAQIQKLTKKC